MGYLPDKVTELILPCNGTIQDYHKVNFKEVLNLFIKQVNDISEEEKKYISLKIGKESCFIEELLQKKIRYITLETLQKIMEYLKLKDTDCWIILDELKNESKENFIFDYPDIELVRKFENILKIYE